MAPIHDSDLASERWSKAEWETFELWEKVEERIRRRKWVWIFATGLVFLILSAVPIVMDQLPRWRAMKIARQLGQVVSQIKYDASFEHQAYRIRFSPDGQLSYTVERASSCADKTFTVVKSETLVEGGFRDQFRTLSPADGEKLGIPGLVQTFCYDSLTGSGYAQELVGFGVIPVKDLSEGRVDRLSILLLKGASGEMSFD